MSQLPTRTNRAIVGPDFQAADHYQIEFALVLDRFCAAAFITKFGNDFLVYWSCTATILG